VCFNPRDGEIHAEISGMDLSISLAVIPDGDFESTAPMIAFETACDATVVVCKHQAGNETWLPADMWLPGDFTPKP
jgi:hypothetical protein